MAKHISANRVAESKELVLWKKIKKPFKKAKGLAGNKDVVDVFKYCYPNLWKEVCEFHKEMVLWNSSRKKKHLGSVYSFASPELFLKSHLSVKADTSLIRGKSIKEAEAYIESIRKQSLAKLRSREKSEAKREQYKQHTQPHYVAQHIYSYFQTRKLHPEDVDTRYLIVHELAKYKCDYTIKFLTGLVRCKKNLPLQHYALQNLMNLV